MTILDYIDLDHLRERRRRAQKIVLRTEDGRVLAVGHRAPNEFDTPWPQDSGFMRSLYTRESIVRAGLYTYEEIDSYLRENGRL